MSLPWCIGDLPVEYQGHRSHSTGLLSAHYGTDMSLLQVSIDIWKTFSDGGIPKAGEIKQHWLQARSEASSRWWGLPRKAVRASFLCHCPLWLRFLWQHLFSQLFHNVPKTQRYSSSSSPSYLPLSPLVFSTPLAPTPVPASTSCSGWGPKPWLGTRIQILVTNTIEPKMIRL